MCTYLYSILFLVINTVSSNNEKSIKEISINIAAQTDIMSISIQKLNNGTFNLMAEVDISTMNEQKMICDSADFDVLLKYVFQDNTYIKMDDPIIETFINGCKKEDGTESAIKTVRLNTIIHLTEEGKKTDNFKIAGSTQCTIASFCNFKETGFELTYEKDEMKVVSEYVPFIYSN